MANINPTILQYSDEELRKLKEKWEYVDENITSEEVKQYIDYKYLYWGTATDSDLWKCFQEDFGSFITATFNVLSTRKLQILRDYLLGRGVYVASTDKVKKITVAVSLVRCAQEYYKHRWTKEEVLAVLDKGIDIDFRILLNIASDTPPSTIPALRQYPYSQSFEPLQFQYETAISQVPQDPPVALH